MPVDQHGRQYNINESLLPRFDIQVIQQFDVTIEYWYYEAVSDGFDSENLLLHSPSIGKWEQGDMGQVSPHLDVSLRIRIEAVEGTIEAGD